MDELVNTARALADPTRVRVLAALRGGELCVCELSDALGVAQSTLSTHLQVIRETGLVRTRRQGRWVYYALEPRAKHWLRAVWGCFAGRLEQNPLVRRDAGRLKKRLAEREEGACCRGFNVRQT